MATLLRARDSFVGAALIQGVSVEVNVAAGQVVRSDNPAVTGREHLFEPLDPDEPNTPAPAPRTKAARNMSGAGSGLRA